MIATTNRGVKERPTFTTLMCELGVMLFTIAAWAQAQGLLLSSSWKPVAITAAAGVLYGPVKQFLVLPDRRKVPQKRGAAWVAHLLKTAVLSFGCAVAAIALGVWVS